MFWKKNLFQKDTFFTFSMYDFMKNCKFQKKLMVFIEFLLDKSYEKLLFTKNNTYLMIIYVKSLEYASFKNRGSSLF